MDINLPNAIAGLLVGIVVGATGVGGGALMTPLLVLVFGVAPQTAVGTDLLFAALTKILERSSTIVRERWTGRWFGAWPWAVFPPPQRPLPG